MNSEETKKDTNNQAEASVQDQGFDQNQEEFQANSQGYDEPFYDEDLYMPPQPEEIVYEWEAPSRPFKKRKKQYYTTIITIALLLCLILFFAGQVLTVAVVIAVAFLSYVMATIPPQTVTNAITSYGIRNEEALYYWDELGRYWFEKKHDDQIMQVEVDRFPFRLTLVLGSAKQDELEELLSQVLLREKPPLTVIERWAQWLQEKIPLDIDS